MIYSTHCTYRLVINCIWEEVTYNLHSVGSHRVCIVFSFLEGVRRPESLRSEIEGPSQEAMNTIPKYAVRPYQSDTVPYLTGAHCYPGAGCRRLF